MLDISNAKIVRVIRRVAVASDPHHRDKAHALAEATAPTEQYLSGIPGLAEHLESGLDRLGVDVSHEEDQL